MSDPNENRPGYKETKVGWIPEEWKCEELQSIVNPKRPICYGVVQAGDHQADGIACVRVTDLVDGVLDPNGMLKTTPEINRQYRRTSLEEGDVMVALRGEAGKAALVPPKLAGSNLTRGVALVSQADDLCGRYLVQAMAAPSAKLLFARSVNGTALQEISIRTLKKFPAIVPPLPEQKEIADILSTCDEAIEKTGALIDAKKRQKKALMQQLLTGKKRLPGFKGVWEFPKAEEVFERITQRGGGAEPVLSVTQYFGVVDRTEVGKRIDYDESNTHTYKLVEPNDFVISLRSFQGGLEISNLRGLVSPAYHVIRSRKPCCHQFYKYYFKSFEFIGRLDIAVIGIRDGKQVSYGDFSFLKIPYPPVEEQSAIADTLSAADSEMALLEARRSALKQQKKALMQKLLTGQVRVKV